jgi:hypothetical protein
MDTEPITTYASWHPATVLLPDRSVLHRTRVYATDQGLKVFTRRPEDGVSPQWESLIVFAETSKPDLTVRNNGVDFQTEDGLVVVTPMGACKCGGLGRWIPKWASNVAEWPAA